jgi:hypothetical protein
MKLIVYIFPRKKKIVYIFKTKAVCYDTTFIIDGKRSIVVWKKEEEKVVSIPENSASSTSSPSAWRGTVAWKRPRDEARWLVQRIGYSAALGWRNAAIISALIWYVGGSVSTPPCRAVANRFKRRPQQPREREWWCSSSWLDEFDYSVARPAEGTTIAARGRRRYTEAQPRVRAVQPSGEGD